jgi:hypothetical protein
MLEAVSELQRGRPCLECVKAEQKERILQRAIGEAVQASCPTAQQPWKGTSLKERMDDARSFGAVQEMKTIGLDERLLHSSWVTGRRWLLSELLDDLDWDERARLERCCY